MVEERAVDTEREGVDSVNPTWAAPVEQGLRVVTPLGLRPMDNLVGKNDKRVKEPGAVYLTGHPGLRGEVASLVSVDWPLPLGDANLPPSPPATQRGMSCSCLPSPTQVPALSSG